MITVRGYVGKALIFKETVDCTGLSDEAMQKLANEQLARVCDFPMHMLEIEFMDEPDVNHRFLRLGTDTSRMRNPKEIGKGRSIEDEWMDEWMEMKRQKPS